MDSVSIYTLKSQSSLPFKPNFRGGSEEWAHSFAEGHLIGYQVWFCICSNNCFSFCSASKVSACYYTTFHWHKYILWVIKYCKTNNEPAFWISIQLKVNPEPNKHN